MKLYALQYMQEVGGLPIKSLRLTYWCASMTEASEAYDDKTKAGLEPIIRIITVPGTREAMAFWLNERGVTEGPRLAEPV